MFGPQLVRRCLEAEAPALCPCLYRQYSEKAVVGPQRQLGGCKAEHTCRMRRGAGNGTASLGWNRNRVEAVDALIRSKQKQIRADVSFRCPEVVGEN